MQPGLADVVRDDQLSAFPVKNADGTWAENRPIPFDAEETREGMLEIWFGRVSVCDCFILRCNGETMMIDGGMIQHSAGTLYLLENLGITGVNYLFNTHHHDDHLEMQEYLLRKKGFNIVAITDNPDAPVAKVAQYSICVPRRSYDYTDSFVTTTMLLNTLAVYVGLHDKSALIGRLRQYDETTQSLEFFF